MTIRPFAVPTGTLARILAASLLAAIIAQAALGPGGVAPTYLRLGIEHILFGFDHLLFVLVLVILVRDWRRVAQPAIGKARGAVVGWLR